MAASIFTFLFNDKIRTLATMFLLLAILASNLANWAFPRHPTVNKETIKLLEDVKRQIKETAENLTNQSIVTSRLNERLAMQLEEMESARNESYKELIKKYGGSEERLDPNTLDYRDFIDNPELVDRLHKEN